ELPQNGSSQKVYSFAENYTRVHKMETELSGRVVDRIIRGWLEQLSGVAERPEVPLIDLVNNYSGGKVQLTAPRLTRTDDIDRELEQLTSTFVLEEKQPRDLGLADRSLRKQVREVFAENQITDHLE